MEKKNIKVIKIVLIIIIFFICINTIPVTECVHPIRSFWYTEVDEGHRFITLQEYINYNNMADVSVHIYKEFSIPYYIIIATFILAILKTNKKSNILLIIVATIIAIIMTIIIVNSSEISKKKKLINDIRSNNDKRYYYIKLDNEQEEIYVVKDSMRTEYIASVGNIRYIDIIKIINNKTYNHIYTEMKEKENFFQFTIDGKTYKIEKQILE